MCYSRYKNVQHSSTKNLIAETSGHRSLKGLRAYEKTSEDREISARQSIQVGKAFLHHGARQINYTLSVVVKENCVPGSAHDGCGPGKPGVGPLQQLSGLSHCTFNFYQS